MITGAEKKGGWEVLLLFFKRLNNVKLFVGDNEMFSDLT
jgi:hypothetical protein